MYYAKQKKLKMEGEMASYSILFEQPPARNGLQKTFEDLSMPR